jgi:alpha-L-fucosidase
MFFQLAVLVALGSFHSAARGAPSLSDATPSWDELDARPLPDWYDRAKFGIFVSWGVGVSFLYQRTVVSGSGRI